MDTDDLQARLQEELAKASSGGGGDGLLFGMSGWALFWGFAFGVFGWFIFRHGRKKMNPALIGIGIALMVYPYFITNTWWTFGVGAVLCAVSYKIW